MRVGTKSLLFGVHQFAFHPFMVAFAWFQLYGFRRIDLPHDERYRFDHTSLLDWRLWLAFLVHDWGYWGKPNMDEAEGETHPELGARLVRWVIGGSGGDVWHDFVLCYSRFYAAKIGKEPSALCLADKLAIGVPPRWLYLALARASGEIREYMAKSHNRNETGGKYAHANLSLEDEASWYRDMCAYMRKWVEDRRPGITQPKLAVHHTTQARRIR